MTWDPPKGKPGVYETKEEAIVKIGCAVSVSIAIIGIGIAVAILITRSVL